ncbi:MAG: hypothetical protein UR26_C0004G0060 [candidate division TM6 bacterium GW2011_GWF2_32_72]|nr:MAG: hypothetical protein UR26_C0004G0060 [candidate division TM6 bacterium GW2011_GWF2_32_72]
MNKIIIVFGISTFIVGLINTCPDCIGTLNDDAPPFFSDEYYQAPDEAKKIVNLKATENGFEIKEEGE